MNALNSILKKSSFLLILLTMLLLNVAHAQKSKKEVAVEKLIASKNYVFKAQMALPLGGRSINLTSDYDLRISDDTLVSYLPYYGRAYVAPIDPTQGGIQFTSTNFEYHITDNIKGGWNVEIKPLDNHDVQQMALSISEKGYATLQVISNNRQAISFNGYITERTQRKKK